jgi:hypothetical protein
MEIGKIILKKKIFWGILAGVGFVLLSDFMSIKAYNKYMKTSFSGNINSVQYSVKGDPIIFIKSCNYCLSYSYTNSISLDFKSFIQVGDSVVKKEGSSDIYVYRKIGSTYKECLFEKY